MQNDRASSGPSGTAIRYRRPFHLWIAETFGEDGLAFTIWAGVYGCLYSLVMRFAHRFGWCYMEKSTPGDDGDVVSWCHWCGLRSITSRSSGVDIRRPLCYSHLRRLI